MMEEVDEVSVSGILANSYAGNQVTTAASTDMDEKSSAAHRGTGKAVPLPMELDASLRLSNIPQTGYTLSDGGSSNKIECKEAAYNVSKVELQSSCETSALVGGGASGDGLDTDVEDVENLSLNEEELSMLSLDEICPDPPAGNIFETGQTATASGSIGSTSNYDSDSDSFKSLSLSDGESGKLQAPGSVGKRYKYRKTLVPTQEQLLALDLQDGENELLFELEGCTPLKSQLFLWPDDAKIVVSDIEGAITVSKSMAGFIGFFISRSAAHDGVAQLLNNIHKNGYKILYIATKTLAQVMSTKDHLAKVAGVDCNLPAGPIFQSPESLVRAFGEKRTDIFKRTALRGVRQLFPEKHNPYYAGFGTREFDLEAMTRSGLPEGRVYLVNEKGEVKGKNRTFHKTFIEINRDLDSMFPPVRAEACTDDSFSNFNFWKIPLPNISL